ncbi:hypothetical protein LTR37_003992 [Vermiconidia calcicola]|uniref:Uncharacterized protein n=1 Tax=Vermiconidia calcicola TaxID=1690605 RepID=A0ACC3NNH4_9PEZI|nr:hypothetical protein LTR37_003992 [Vermiconidia calcicola]
MAKTKASTPKKGAKPTAAEEQTTIRRSPRKAVESAKKKEATVSPPAKVVKRASPAKKASSPAKQSTPSKATSKAKESPATAKSAKTAKSGAANPSPKPRGRPRKDTTATRKAHEAAGVAAQGREDEWTDSPKKKSPSKRSTKAAPTATSTAEDGDEYDDNDDDEDEGAQEADLGGVRKSIETSNTGKRGRGQARNTSKSPSRTASKSPAASGARSTTVGRATSKGGARSKSPVKAAARSATDDHEKSSAVTATARSMSPTKRATRPVSHGVSDGPCEKISGTAKRGRPPGSTKAKAAEASRAPSKAPTTSLAKSPGRPSSRRSLSKNSDAGPIRVDKTRASRSPSKTPQRTAARTRSVSPVKRAAQGRASRRSSAPAVSPGRARSKSPAKALRSPSRKAFDEKEFEKWFHDDSPYGRALRRIESSAYKHRKAGKEFDDSSDEVEADHDQRAKARGVQRAELEVSLRNGSSGHGQTPSSSNSQTKRKASKELESPRKKFTRARSPGSRQPSMSANEDVALQPGQPSAPHRGTVRSVTNPEFIPDTNNKKNPFFETMPAPEVWHRRMPPYLPFGETPFMEAELSRQINKDLSKGKSSKEQTAQKEQENTGFFGRTVSGLTSWISWGPSKPGSPDHRYTAPWDMPEASDAELQKAARASSNLSSSSDAVAGRKRASSPLKPIGSPKRPRRRSSGHSEFSMSGALSG